MSLYVTHGIFSKGFSVFNNLIDQIYTTNSFKSKTELERVFNHEKSQAAGTTFNTELSIIEI